MRMQCKTMKAVGIYALLGALMVAANAESTPPLLLPENGKTQYRIVIARDAPEGEDGAAKELAKVLGQITGAEFPVGRDDEPESDSEIVVGDTRRKSVSPGHAAAKDPFCKLYFDALLQGVEGAKKHLPEMLRAADEVAGRLVAGGHLYIACARSDFVSEGSHRGGGLMLLKRYSPSAEPTPKDVVIVGWTNTTPGQDLALLRALRRSGALVIGIGPKPPPNTAKQLLSCVDAVLESSSPLPATVTGHFGDESYPLVSIENLVLLWTLQGEIVAACTRHGRMPTLYQSVLVPGGRERNAKYRGLRFHKKHDVPPVPPGLLGRSYLKEIAVIFRNLRDKETAVIHEVASACNETRKGGRQIHAFLIGHFPAYQAGAPGDPKFMRQLDGVEGGEKPVVKELQQKMRAGDLFFFLGYYRRPTASYEAARQVGVRIVEVIAGADTPPGDAVRPDYVIHPGWPYHDALVAVPHYDVKILPGSGVVQASIFWAVQGAMTQ